MLQTLKGLRTISDVPNLKLDKSVISLSSNKQQVTFELVDNFGNPLKGVKEVSVSLVSIGDKSEAKDLTKSTKMNKDNNEGTVTLSEAEIGRFNLKVTVDSKYTVQHLITVTDKLKIKSVAYSVSPNKKFPTDFTSSVSHPEKISKISSATNDLYLHMGVSASFVKSAAKPA